MYSLVFSCTEQFSVFFFKLLLLFFFSSRVIVLLLFIHLAGLLKPSLFFVSFSFPFFCDGKKKTDRSTRRRKKSLIIFKYRYYRCCYCSFEMSIKWILWTTLGCVYTFSFLYLLMLNSSFIFFLSWNSGTSENRSRWEERCNLYYSHPSPLPWQNWTPYIRYS